MPQSTHLADVLWKNPIIRMQMRRKLRKKSVIVWGLLTLIPSLFIFLNTYNATNYTEFNASPEEIETAKLLALKACFLPIFFVQAFILLFVGTGTVAGNFAEEKESGLIDYHRMTPMSPAAKIVGFVLGLPCREYLMAMLTLPFTLIAVLGGKLPLPKVVLVYVILLCLALTYHLTAMASGMLAKKPRMASWFSRILVILLYTFLPVISHIGLSVFGYVTFLPTLYGLFQIELKDTFMFRGNEQVQFFEVVPFYFWKLPPVLFTFLILGLMMSVFAFMLLRKWQKDTYHPFTKRFAIGVFAVIQILVIGSLIPILLGEQRSDIVNWMSPSEIYGMVQFLHLLISLGISILLIHLITPTRHTLQNGLRRARKHKLSKIPFNWDSASSFPACSSFIAMGILFCLVLQYIARTELNLSPKNFALPRIILPLVLFSSMMLYLQASRTLWSKAGYFGFLALFWLVPLLCGMTLSAFDGDEDPLIFLGIPNPIIAFLHIYTPPLEGLTENKMAKTLTLGCHVGVAVFLHLKAIHWRKEVENSMNGEDLHPAPEPPADLKPAPESAQ